MTDKHPNPTRLLELAERCEQATGPDVALERHIALAIGWKHLRNKGPTQDDWPYHWVALDGSCHEGFPDYLTSLDAAMSLVPAGEFVCVDGPRKYLNIPTPVPNHWRACIGYNPEHRGWGATPALALTAAALKARAQ